ncbi:MAG: hypothetical protein RKO24_00920 [Candidatus Competibacter sp.]|nr:hypothetical protein [Candidatus Competibacter sp.]
MKLSDLQPIIHFDLRRDGFFQSLGLLSHNTSQILVMFYNSNFLGELVNNPHIACVITEPDLVDQLPDHLGVAVCSDALATFYQIHDYLLSQTDFYGEPFDSEISPDALIHHTAYVSPHNVRIAKGVRIGPCAVILDHTTICESVVIGPNVVIGGEGFEPKFVNGQHIIVRHAGGVFLHNGVEIQANSHVAKAVFNSNTEIGSDTKIDALVHIAHNVCIGSRCEIAASAMVAGSTNIGNDVWIGPCAVLSSEISVGDHAFVAIGAVVLKDVPAGERVAGIPAKPLRSHSSSK